MNTPEDAELDRVLAAAQPRWMQDGRGIRGNDRQIISQTVRQEWPDPVITVTHGARPPVKALTNLVPPLQALLAATGHPFKVLRVKDEAGVRCLVVTPGKIALVMPTYQGIALDLPGFQPKIYPLEKAQFLIALKCMIDLTDSTVHYRSHIKSVDVKLDNEIDGTDFTAEGKLNEYHIVWDIDIAEVPAPEGSPEGTPPISPAGSRQEKGYFWILIAAVNMVEVDNEWVVKSIDQSLKNNLLTFAILGDVAMALVKE